ncbi:ATP-binding protein [Dehalococcoidia bacterium]|nr:ATP-binding protein [Dehalococcoidia bacterium]
MTIIKKGENLFRPRARLLVLLGEQLITNEVIAVVELVKNAYDADADKVEVLLDNVAEPAKGQIVIEDNGAGMSLDTILNVWLEPATDFRKRQREGRKRTAKFRRLPLGEKGVGRFAAHKLGNLVEVATKEEGSSHEVVVGVDWQEFEKDEYLDRIPVAWFTRDAEVFRGKAHGTRITIRDLRKEWTPRMIETLHVKLQALNSPFMDRTDFVVTIRAPEFAERLAKLPEVSEIVKKRVYSLEGGVDENGMLHFTYSFFNPAFPLLKREVKDAVTEDAKDPRKFAGKRRPHCGPFRVKFYAWDLDPATLGETIERVYYNNYVKPHTGIRIYRDGFRVWPYGEEDDDSFGLDLRRVNNPTVCLSRNQVIGIVETSAMANPELRDKTDREGIILNKEYEDFRELVIGCLSVLEAERRKDKDRVDALRKREKKKPEDEVHRAIGAMKAKMEKKGHIDIYRKEVTRIESAYEQRVREILEPLYVSAGLGIAYTIPVHEIVRNIGDMEKLLDVVIEDLRKTGTGNGTVERLRQVLQTTDVVDDLVRGVGKLTHKGKAEVLTLASVARDALDISKLRLAKDLIHVDIVEKGKVKVTAIRNMLITAVLNLLDNSSYWLLRRESGRKIIIRIDHAGDGKPRILVGDNGPGIKDDPVFLMQPFFTRKPDGSGLGLYIVDRIMKAHEGETQFLFNGDEAGLLEGANIALVFPKEREERK